MNSESFKAKGMRAINVIDCFDDFIAVVYQFDY